ncbi:uncharacterized protein LOC144139041 [Haemaphysalis longicornis]
MTKIWFLLLSAFRDFVKFALHLVSPASKMTVAGLLSLLQQNQAHTTNFESRMLHDGPNGCKDKWNVTIPENAGIKHCVILMDGFCNTRSSRHRASMGFLLSAIVCFLKNIPVINVPDLLKEISCTTLKNVIAVLDAGRLAPVLSGALKFLQLYLNCDSFVAIRNTQE